MTTAGQQGYIRSLVNEISSLDPDAIKLTAGGKMRAQGLFPARVTVPLTLRQWEDRMDSREAGEVIIQLVELRDCLVRNAASSRSVEEVDTGVLIGELARRGFDTAALSAEAAR